MAVKACKSSDYDSDAKMVDKDSHLAKHFNKKAAYDDEVQGAAMPRKMGGESKAKAVPTPITRPQAERYGK